MRRTCGFFAFVVLLAAARGGVATSSAPGVSTTAARGPVELTVSAAPNVVRVGAPMTIELHATAPEGVDVVMPDPGRAIGDFAVRDLSVPPGVPVEAGRSWTHRYVVDSFAAGAATIPPFTLAFVDRRDPAQVIEGAVTTDALDVVVESALSRPDEPMRSMRGAVDVPVPVDAARLWRTAGVLAAAVLVVLVAAWLLIRFARRPRPAPPPRPAHEVALEAIAALRGEDLVARGHVEALFDRLSGIVRVYVEGRFGIHAPERTTEEFLQEAARSGTLGEGHRVLLASFLRAADLVKFARHRPEGTEGNDVLDRAEGFVRETVPGTSTEAVTEVRA